MSILNPEHHGWILRNKPAVLSKAGISEWYLDNSMTKCTNITKTEIDFVKTFNMPKESKNPPGYGFVYSKKTPNADGRMASIVGALLRNYIDARVVPINEVVGLVKDDNDLTSVTLLCIPDLYMSGSESQSNFKWQMSAVHSLLMARGLRGKKTLVYVESLHDFTAAFKGGFADTIQTKFVSLGA